jgi:hypothetical protein
MQNHEFIKRNTHRYDYNLIFDKYHSVFVILPAPAVFDFQNKQRYFLHENEVHEYNTAVEAACLVEEAAQNASMSYHFNYYPGQPWQ